MKILDKEVKLNDIATISYLNKNNQWSISCGRVYNWDDHYLYLDVSDSLDTLDETVKVRRDGIKYITVTNNLWR